MGATIRTDCLLRWCCLVIFLAVPASSSWGQDAHRQEIAVARDLIAQQQYDQAMTLLRNLIRAEDCGRTCEGESYLLTAYCWYRQGQDALTRADLKESVSLRPKYELDTTAFPAGFVRLYRQVRSQTLCSLEIRVKTKHSLALSTSDSLMDVYRQENIPAGPIQLIENLYGKRQRYFLNPGRLNVFELELEELRDYWSFDSLHLSFSPDLTGVPGGAKKSASTQGQGCVKIWRHCFELLPSNFQPDPLSFIVIGDSGTASNIAVRLATPQWKKLNEDLRSNANRRRLSRIVKISSGVGCVATAVWAVYSNSEADKRYELYLQEYDRYELSQLYRSYEDLIEQRNILMISSIVLAAVNVASFIFAAGDKQDLLEKFERNNGNSGIVLSVGQGALGLNVKLGV